MHPRGTSIEERASPRASVLLRSVYELRRERERHVVGERTAIVATGHSVSGGESALGVARSLERASCEHVAWDGPAGSEFAVPARKLGEDTDTGGSRASLAEPGHAVWGRRSWFPRHHSSRKQHQFSSKSEGRLPLLTQGRRSRKAHYGAHPHRKDPTLFPLRVPYRISARGDVWPEFARRGSASAHSASGAEDRAVAAQEKKRQTTKGNHAISAAWWRWAGHVARLAEKSPEGSVSKKCQDGATLGGGRRGATPTRGSRHRQTGWVAATAIWQDILRRCDSEHDKCQR